MQPGARNRQPMQPCDMKTRQSHRRLHQVPASMGRPLIFVHIPKTGGMTFAPIITRNFPRNSVIKMNGTLVSCAERLNNLPEKTRAAVRCIYGHVPFGLHDCLSRPAAYVTLLRNPVERLVSAYYYSLRRPEWGFHKAIVERRLSLHEFMAGDAAAELHNGQTRMLSGSDEPVTTISALDTAKMNLRRHFAFVGLTERFDESVLLCVAALGLNGRLYRKRNVNRHRAPIEDIPLRTVALIEKRNSLDLELYDMARRDFDELVKRFPDLAGEIATLRRWNACYAFADSLLNLPFNVLQDIKTAVARARARNGRSPTGTGERNGD